MSRREEIAAILTNEIEEIMNTHNGLFREYGNVMDEIIDLLKTHKDELNIDQETIDDIVATTIVIKETSGILGSLRDDFVKDKKEFIRKNSATKELFESLKKRVNGDRENLESFKSGCLNPFKDLLQNLKEKIKSFDDSPKE